MQRFLIRVALVAVLMASLSIVVTSPSAIHADSVRAAGISASLDSYITGLSGPNTFSGAVVVARQGTVLLSKGYGMADRALHIPNTPSTRYPVGGVSSNMSLVGALWLEDHGKLSDQALICHYITACPAAWKPISIHMVLDGTANIPGIDWPDQTGTTAHTLQLLQAAQLDGKPGARFDFQNGDTLVLATIIGKVTGESWATFMQKTIYEPAGMRRSGRMTDASVPPGWAQDYAGQTADRIHSYNNFFVVFSTAADIYAYDNALFGGHLLSQRSLTRMFTPLATTFADNSSYIQGLTDEKTCYQAWTSGRAFGHAVLLTINGARSFQTINMRFPHDQATIVVISNNGNDVAAIARHLAALLFGHAVAASPAQTTAAAALPQVIAPAKAVLATYSGATGGWPFALTPGAMWFPTTSSNGDLGTVTRVDTRTGHVVATIIVSKLPNDQHQDSVVVADGQIWAIDHEAQAVVRIDPATNGVVATVPIGMLADQLAVAGTTLWASSGDPAATPDKVVRVDLHTHKVVAVITHVRHPFLDTAATSDAFWYISQDTLQVMRIDAVTNKVVATISAGPVPQTVFVGAGSVWVGDASGALVTRIDPLTNKVIASIKTDGYPGTRRPTQDDCACQYAVGDGAVWVIANNTTLLRIDPHTNHPVAALTFNDDLYAVGLDNGSIWVAGGGQDNYNLYRVDPQAMGVVPAVAAPIMPARVVAPATAIQATFTGQGTVSNFPAAFTPGALWFPTQSPDGYMGTVTRLDTKNGRVVATINVTAPGVLAQGDGEGDVAVVNGQIWAADSRSRTLVRIDSATNRVVATIHLGVPAVALAASGETLWATADPAFGDGIARVDLRTQKVVAVIKDAGHPNGDNAATPDSFWYISADTEKLVRVDAATNKVVATITAGAVPQTVFVGAGSVWVGDASGNLVTRIDPRTNKVVASIKTEGYPGDRKPSLGDCDCRYAVGDGSVWVIANSTTLLRIDPHTNRPVASLTFNIDIGSIALSEGSIWVSSDTSTPYVIYRVDPKAMGAPPLSTSSELLLTGLLGIYRHTFQNAVRMAGRQRSDRAIPMYRLTDLGTRGGDHSRANAINNLGQVVGGSFNATPDPVTPGTNETRAFLWQHGVMTDLGTFGGADSDQFGGNFTGATGINDKGQIVGGATYNTVADPASGDDNPPITCNHAFLWAKGKMTFLGTLKGVTELGNTASHADAINTKGQIVGDSMVPIPDPNNSSAPGAPQVHAFLWEQGKMTDLGTLPSPLNTYSQAFAINDRGQVVGESGYHDAAGHPFFWSKGVMTDIGTFGGPTGQANAITNKGQVVGGADTIMPDPSNPGGFLGRAFLWTGGKLRNLGTYGNDPNSTATGINNSGQIVGWTATFTAILRALLWQNGKTIDLNTRIPAHSGLHLNAAFAINDRGQIVGFGTKSNGRQEAFLLTPITKSR